MPMIPFLRWMAWFSVGLAMALCSGCTEMTQTSSTIGTWMHDYASWGRYRATPQQIQIAQVRAVHHYQRLSAEKKKEMQEKGHRYLAVRTSDPTPEQLAEIRKTASTKSYTPAPSTYGGLRRRTPTPPASTEAPVGPWHCVIIWDTTVHEVVGNDCYAVTNLPPPGQFARFDTYSAEYIADGE